MLTADERRLAQTAFYCGPAVLLEDGWSTEAVAAFVQRPDVQEVWTLLKREFDIHEGLRARAKHAALRNLHRMIDPASAVVAQAMAGPEYVRDDHGHISTDVRGNPLIRQAAITPVQLRAAELVLEGAGVHDPKVRGDAASDPSLKLLFSTAEEQLITLDDDPANETEEQRALSRERIRNAFERLTPKLIAARSIVRRGLNLDPATEGTEFKVKRKRKRSRARKEG